MSKKRFSLGYFIYNQKTGQYICKPTNIECDSIKECKNLVQKKPFPENQLDRYNISEFDYKKQDEHGHPEFIASCNLEVAIKENLDDLSKYKFL